MVWSMTTRVPLSILGNCEYECAEPRRILLSVPQQPLSYQRYVIFSSTIATLQIWKSSQTAEHQEIFTQYDQYDNQKWHVVTLLDLQEWFSSLLLNEYQSCGGGSGKWEPRSAEVTEYTILT